MLWRVRLTRIFLWLSVLAGGTLIGAKLYDLVVVAGAWSAAPPGVFDANAIWATFPRRLAVSAPSILAVWIFTVVAFWPRNGVLYGAASHAALSMTDRAELVRQAHLWVTYDWCRIAMMTAGFVSAVRAISAPVPTTAISRGP